MTLPRSCRAAALLTAGLALDSHGDVDVASVYPEHSGKARGIEGPSFLRWTRE